MRMKIYYSRQRNRAMTLVELLVVLAVIAMLAVLVWPNFPNGKKKAIRIACINNLKQTGLAFQIWSGDHGTNFPMAVSETNGGSAEFTTGPNAFRHFQVMSNELSYPMVLICPSDALKYPATNWIYLGNSNVSYFVGVDARETNGMMILSGDHNLTDGTPLKNGLLELTTKKPARWTSEMHNKIGNILFADGSVPQDNDASLQTQIANTGAATNRLQMP
jgi:prepilin-type N-terminal cleavage/methylation domain-containing protein/prepilin-type processing-associated H-X9-DG protein